MSDFGVQLTQPAVRDLRLLPDAVHPRIIEGFTALRLDPLSSPPLKKRLKGFGFPLYRLRIADYRILYRIDEKMVTIMRVIDRKDLEKAVRHLKH